MLMHVDIVHRNMRFLGGAKFGSKEGRDLWFGPVISQHDTFAASLHKNHAALIVPLLPRNIPGYQASGKYKTVGNPIDIYIYISIILQR
jgi:hypothetical protein